MWMIEISLREGLLDEYALPVPSPVYCDYRLPGYEDVVAGQMAATGHGAAASNLGTITTSTSTATATSTSASAAPAVNQPRYFGSPPAYESNSENDSEEEEDDNDDDDNDDDDDRESRVGTHIAGEGSGPRSQGDSIVIATIGRLDSAGTSRASIDRNRHRGMEMTAVSMSSGPALSTVQHQQQQQQQTGPARTMTSMSTMSSISTSTSGTSLHTVLVSKEEEEEQQPGGASLESQTGGKED